MWSKDEFMSTVAQINEGDQTLVFEMPVDFDDLAGNDGGIETVNLMVDEFVEDGHKLMDLSYKPLRVEGENIIVEVSCDYSEFMEDD